MYVHRISCSGLAPGISRYIIYVRTYNFFPLVDYENYRCSKTMSRFQPRPESPSTLRLRIITSYLCPESTTCRLVARTASHPISQWNYFDKLYLTVEHPCQDSLIKHTKLILTLTTVKPNLHWDSTQLSRHVINGKQETGKSFVNFRKGQVTWYYANVWRVRARQKQCWSSGEQTRSG